MADWVHCNTCFRQPGSAPKFYLTSCGHIYCSDCLKDGTSRHCRMCKRECTTIPLTAKMKPDVEIFFTDPMEIARRHYKQLTQVVDFQKNHRNRLSAYWREKNSKNTTVLDDAKKKMTNQFNEMERYNRQLQEENNKLRSLVAGAGTGHAGGGNVVKARHPTPGRPMNSPVTHAMRVASAQSKSPQPMRTSSPYGRRNAPSTPGQGGDTCSTPQVRSTPPGPARLSIRTPPVNGRIGTVSTPTTTSNNLSLTPHGSLQLIRANIKTPGLREAVVGASSPMIQSPVSSTRSERYYSSSQPAARSPSSYSQGASHSYSMSQSSSESSRRQIQLHYTPRTPLISAPSSSSQVH